MFGEIELNWIKTLKLWRIAQLLRGPGKAGIELSFGDCTDYIYTSKGPLGPLGYKNIYQMTEASADLIYKSQDYSIYKFHTVSTWVLT